GWDGAVTDTGAVTWGNGLGGTVGPISAANSLVGSTMNDKVGDVNSFAGITALTNGNYLVVNALWDNGAATDAGAATWGNGSDGTVGAVSAANSIVGTSTNDFVGFPGSLILNNGNYVVG